MAMDELYSYIWRGLGERKARCFIRLEGSNEKYQCVRRCVARIWIRYLPNVGSRERSVGIETGCGLDGRGVGVRVPVGSRIFSSPHRPDRFWGPPSLLSNGYRELFPRGYSGRGVKLTSHLQRVPRSRERGSIYPLPHTPSWRSA
jgi:hypothetical protein